MPRRNRQLVDGGHYHLIARANNRFFVFQQEEDYTTFKNLLLQSKKKYPWRLSHYCLMSNHIHLLGEIERGEHLPKLMQYLLFEYSRWYRIKTSYVGHLWQGRYRSPLIERESYFLECGRYIERNPVRAGIVTQAEDYEWSSYRYYAWGELDPLIDEDPYYRGLGPDSALRQKCYQDFIKLPGPYEKWMDRTLLEKYF